MKTYNKCWDFREEDIPQVEAIIDKYGNGCAVRRGETCEIYIESEEKIDGRKLCYELRKLKELIAQERWEDSFTVEVLDNEPEDIEPLFNLTEEEYRNRVIEIVKSLYSV